jgi:hypothetical protein
MFWLGAGAFSAWAYHRHARSPMFWFAAGFGTAVYTIPWALSARYLHAEIHSFFEVLKFEVLKKKLETDEEREVSQRDLEEKKQEVCAHRPMLCGLLLTSMIVRRRCL